MTSTPKYATPQSTVAEVAGTMAKLEIGVLPIVDISGRVLAIITDRDICKGVATMNRPARDVPALSLATKTVACCGPLDDLQSALQTMERNHVRRLPVVDQDGRLRGILSMDDVILKAEDGKLNIANAVTFGEAVSTLKTIYSHRPVRQRIVEH
jgi:CBS domain-containing protein